MRDKALTELRDSTGRRPHYRYSIILAFRLSYCSRLVALGILVKND